MDSVESICNNLARFKVLDKETIRTLRTRSREQNKDRGDQPDEFKRWLTRTGQITDFQLDLLTRGFGEHLYLDDYKLLDRLAKGRHAGVFQAVHGSGQQVAIKVLPPSASKNQHILGRFLRESRLAARLDHDNVVRTFHHGKTAEGTYFIVMEYLEGETLEDVLKRRERLPPAEAVRLLIQALDGLQHLDEKSMIHRDLKPANLMVVSSAAPVPPSAPDSPGGKGDADTTLKSTLKILDVGLSRTLFDEGEPAAGNNVDLTREGTLLGTVNYMAPEQARNAHGADIRADIYALGCVLYEMLTGQPPFADKNLARQIRRHADEKPRPLAELVPGIPEALDRIVQKMLAKDPALRYSTPGQAGKDLRNVLGTLGDPVTSAQPGRPLKTFMTWLETKQIADDDAPAAPLSAELAQPVQTQVADVPANTVMSQSSAPAAQAVPAPPVPVATLPAPARGLAVTPLVPAAAIVLQDTANTAAPASPADAVAADAVKPSRFKAAMSNLGTGCKALAWRFARAVGALTRREWSMIGFGALLVLLLEGMWSLVRWLFY